MNATLDGKVVIVSGAAHGIGAAEGRAICEAGGKASSATSWTTKGRRWSTP